MLIIVNLFEIFDNQDELCLRFQEADNWTTLSADVEEVLDSGDVDAVKLLTALPNYFSHILAHRFSFVLSRHFTFGAFN